ncbi:hypothetical protein RhiirA5_431803 [Rhizophagus irregularis]|uniref:Uncharacterized protein n=1 Tax=Rhizophagus irregularis TaxID=588596 RepID=A0A2N0NUB5_9GLOM|nr:hypothetical protein RhiirA5_431803 [Rhizophagus irregularis]
MGNETDKYRSSTSQKQHNLSVEEVYNKEELSTKLVVKDHNADISFSEVVYGDLPQFPRIHVEFGSLNKLPGTKIVNLLRQILDGMLVVFRIRYSGITNVPKSPKDFVIMDKYGQNRHDYWTNDFHIQATSFTFTDYKEAKEFTYHVRSSLPVEFPDLDCIVPSTPIADRNTKNICDQSTNSVRSISPNTHENTNIKDPHNAVSYHENGFDQRTSSSVEQVSQNETPRDDEQPENTYSSETPREGSITTLSTKKNPPSTNKQYATAINFLVMFFFIVNKIKPDATRQMQGRTRVTKEKKENRHILQGQPNQLQHNRSVKNGKGLGRSTSFGRSLGLIFFIPQKIMEIPNIRLVIISTVIYLYMDSRKRNKKAWLSGKTLRWRIHNSPYIRPGDCLHKNEMTN